MIYCVVPRHLAAKLHDPLRRHFAERPDVEVIVERRHMNRRAEAERRKPGAGELGSAALATEAGAAEHQDKGGAPERRRIRNVGGRRVGDRRAAAVPLETPAPLPRRFRRHAEELVFAERIAPSSEQAEDADTARLVTRLQAGEAELFTDLYTRYFDRVYGHLRVLLRDRHEAEDTVQQVFTQVLEAIGRYERREQPFRAWLFAIARHAALRRLRAGGREEVTEPSVLAERTEQASEGMSLPGFDWISDPDLMLFVERLPVHQRQVLAMRYMLDMSHREVAQVLGKTEQDVRALQHRALGFLRTRLAAVGRSPRRGQRTPVRRCPDKANVLRARRFALLR